VNAVLETIERAVDELLGRASGPMHLRLFLQPIVASVLAVRAGLRDARSGQPPFLWTFFTDAASRPRLFKSACKDIGKAFLVGVTVDAIYQAIQLRAFHLVQALLVAVVLAVLPYSLLRGPVTRLARRSGRDAGSNA
jgi:hypothetical protein